MRADGYALLATLLRSEPDNHLLDTLAVALHDGTEFGAAIGELAAAAAAHPQDAVAEEFHTL
ncbi:MAG: TorA maturation chaperone TorD, partial [Alphaproteobacteria bacterium]